MREPGMPSDSLEITMSALGLQNPANPSMPKRSPVGGSLTDCGLNWASAGEAVVSSRASTQVQPGRRNLHNLANVPLKKERVGRSSKAPESDKPAGKASSG